MRNQNQSQENKDYHQHETSELKKRDTATHWKNRRTQPIHFEID